MRTSPANLAVMLSLLLAVTGEAADVPETREFDPDALEPSVTIQEHDNRTVEEYRYNNNLYMIKVKPKNAPEYTVVDVDGRGEMEWRRDTLGMEVNPPRWTLLKW